TATTTGRQQPWVEARTLGDEPLGSVFDPFPLDRNNVLATRDSSQLLALTSRHAFVRAPRTPAPRPRAGVAAAARIGDGLVVVISRHALGALGPQFRPTTAPVQQLDALERTGEFLHALARWTRRPAEWAHVPPAAHGVPLALAPAPVPVQLAPPLGGRGEAAAADKRRVDPPAGLRERAPRRSGFVAGRARRSARRPVRPRLDLMGGGAAVGVRRPRPARRGAAHPRHRARSRRRRSADLLDGPGVLRRSVAARPRGPHASGRSGGRLGLAPVRGPLPGATRRRAPAQVLPRLGG